MSIVVLRIGDNFAALAGDGVATDPWTGKVCAFVSKIHLAPEYDAMFGVTGSMGFGQVMMLNKSHKVLTFDDFVDDLPRQVLAAHEGMLNMGLAGGGETLSNVMVCGWSEKSQEYVGLRITTYDKESTQSASGEKKILKAFEPHFVPSGGMIASTGIDQDVIENFKIFDEKQQEFDGPLNHMVRMVAGARASETLLTDEGYPGNIGGYVQLALFQRPQMSSSIVHRWPEDVVGKAIDPSQGEALPAFLLAHDAQA